MSGIHILHRDSGVCQAAALPLKRVGFPVSSFTSLGRGTAVVAAESPDLVLLEWLGAESAREFLAKLPCPARQPATKVIVIADQGMREDAAQAWDLGIEDCLVHPFSAAELLARVRAALRRPARAKGESIAAGPIVLDRASHQVLVAGQPLALAPTEFRLLRFLLENQSRVFSRQELLDRAWGDKVHAGPRTVDVHVRRLRQVLEPFACEATIQTVRGFGYRLSPLPAVAQAPVGRVSARAELSRF